MVDVKVDHRTEILTLQKPVPHPQPGGYQPLIKSDSIWDWCGAPPSWVRTTGSPPGYEWKESALAGGIYSICLLGR